MNWISVKERLPESSEQVVMAYANDQIYMGKFNASESYQWVNGEKQLYQKWIYFETLCWLEDFHCRQCDVPGKKCGSHDNQCVDYCEKENDIAMKIISFSLDKVSHWMELPNSPFSENPGYTKESSLLKEPFKACPCRGSCKECKKTWKEYLREMKPPIVPFPIPKEHE